MSTQAKHMLLTGTMLAPLQMLAQAPQSQYQTLVRADAAGVRDAIHQWGDSPDALVAGMHLPTMPTKDSVTSAFWFLESIQLCRQEGKRLPRYAVGLVPHTAHADASAIRAALGSLTRYATSNLLFDEISINLVVYTDTPVGHQRAAATTQALTSGLLDIVRGQTLYITED